MVQQEATTLLVEKQNGVCTLTINRPQIKNAVDEAIRACDVQSDTRVIVITGTGGAFSSGADIAAALQPGVTPSAAHRILTEAYAPTLRAIRDCPWPVIAAVDGMAAGIGCDLALVCDLRLVSERGVFAEL